MQCAHQQPGRESPELRDCQNATLAGHSREIFRNPVESFWLKGASKSRVQANQASINEGNVKTIH